MSLIFLFLLSVNNYYDVTIKRYPDGTIQYRANLLYLHSSSFIDSPGAFKEKKSDPIRSAKNSYKRSTDKLYDILHSNIWDYFFTLTLDSKKVNRYDYIKAVDCISHFTNLICKYGGLYVIVPERHKDGAWHFHGLINNLPDHCLVVNDMGYFEFRSYHYGYCSLSRVIDSSKASNYIMKYITKGWNYLDIPKGKKRYWASRGLQLPDIEYDVFTEDQINEAIKDSFYYKEIDNDFYKGYIIDVREY